MDISISIYMYTNIYRCTYLFHVYIDMHLYIHIFNSLLANNTLYSMYINVYIHNNNFYTHIYKHIKRQ